MKGIFATTLLTAVLYVSAHGPHDEMYELLCESNDEYFVKGVKQCWKKGPQEFQDLFSSCQEKLSAKSDEKLCKSWDAMMNCTHEDFDHKEDDYKEATECIFKLYRKYKGKP
ncbi:uncharacterized protein LOC143257636 isoform X2 [Tachypleus tridentatus]|uniref:uncharacterized protein LOC143257636 isoform X2 n=1 Tax=Tachypleus tridentatus TaxID=6853 RepID=UPI003FD2D273